MRNMNGIELSACNPKIHLFINVQNAREVRERVMKAELPCAVLNPKFVVDEFQILVAAQIALNNQSNQTMTTRSIYSEIIYNMSSNKKISDSLKTFGMNDTDTAVICVTLDDTNSQLVKESIRGDLRDLSEIHTNGLSKIDDIKKIYKIKEEELKVGTLLEAVVNRMSSKEIMTFQ